MAQPLLERFAEGSNSVDNCLAAARTAAGQAHPSSLNGGRHGGGARGPGVVRARHGLGVWARAASAHLAAAARKARSAQ